MGPNPRRIPSLGQPVPAQPEDPWNSLNDKWGISRAEVQQQVANAPPQAAEIVRQGLEAAAPTATPARPVTLDQMGPNVPSFNNNSVPDFKTAKGGYVGATTDAEASRNLQSRFEQDAAASQMAASMNRGADAMRDTRATKLGIGRGTLDQMEGRMDSPYIQRSAPEAPKLPGIFDRPGDGFGDAGMRQAKFEGMLSDAGSLKGFGSRRKGERMINAALGMLQPGIENQKNAAGLMEKGIEAQTEQAKSLNDLFARNQMTPYQAQSLGLERDKLSAMQGQKQALKLEDLGKGLADDPRYASYAKAKNYMAMMDAQNSSSNPSDHARLALTAQQLARPESEPNDYTTKVLEASTGDWWDRMTGPIKQGLGFSKYSEEQRNRLYQTGKGSFEAKQDEGYAAINDVVQRIVAKGGNPADVLNPSDLKLWKDRQSQPQSSQGGAQYRYDPEKGLIPVQ